MKETLHDLLLGPGDLDEDRLVRLTEAALSGTDDGELFLEYRETESLVLDDGRLKTASFDSGQGFGLRGICGEATGFAHSNEISERALKRAGNTVQAVRRGYEGRLGTAPRATNRRLYLPDNPVLGRDFSEKVRLLTDMDAYAREKDSRVRQVTAALSADWQAVMIIRPGARTVTDIRPLTRLNISVVMEDGERMEGASHGGGGRIGYRRYFSREHWQGLVDEALRQADVNMQSVDAPAGEMAVVLGPGWPGILLHEAVGHGLEGDFNRKQTSAFHARMGKRVASPGVTVVDDGTIEKARGSLTVDDEGTPTEPTVLIEDGILKGFMQDRMNARLMGQRPTGNGRRESFAHAPMPRMTNTFMLAGDDDPADILSSVRDGLYAVSFGGGQVDITSGKFVFSCTEAYRIRDGKISEPVKGATLIGSGPEVLTRVSRIGNDLEMDPGVGTCGKGGQSVPAGVGQPTILVDRLTVGGTALG